MAARAPLTLAEKQRLYAEKLRGRSLSTIAAELGCSRETARKCRYELTSTYNYQNALLSLSSRYDRLRQVSL